MVEVTKRARAILSAAAAIMIASVFMGAAGVTPAVAAGAGWTIHMATRPTVFAAQGTEPETSGRGYSEYHVYVTNMSGHEAVAGTKISVDVDGELEVAGGGQEVQAEDLLTEVSSNENPLEGEWECTHSPEPPMCTYLEPVPAYDTLVMTVSTRAGAVHRAEVESSASVEGGGAGFSKIQTGPLRTPVGMPAPSFGLQETYMEALNGEGGADALAGDHPAALNTGFAVSTVLVGSGARREVKPTGYIRQVSFTLPLGFVGNPQTLAKCRATDLVVEGGSRCQDASRIGALVIDHSVGSSGGIGIASSGGANKEISYVYNMVPEAGFPVEFGFNYSNRAIVLYGSVVKTSQGYAVKVSGLVPNVYEIEGVHLTVFGDPAVVNGEAAAGSESAAFLRNPTSCGSGALSATAEAESWEELGVHTSSSTPLFPEGLSGCDALQFNPTIESAPVGPSAKAADTPSSYAVTLKVPQAPSLIGVPSTSDLRDATVALPAGVALSPPSGIGLQGCTAGQFYDEPEVSYPGEAKPTIPAECPEASQVGAAELRTPLLEESIQPLKGKVYVAQPECDPCSAADAETGRLLHLYVQLEAPSVGLYLKLTGTGRLNSAGRVVTTFADNPQLPFSEFKLTFHGGQRAPLANPQTCGTFTTTSTLESWSAPAIPSSTPSSEFTIDNGCTNPFAPAFSAGTTVPLAGSYSPFTLTLSRQDREQDLLGLSTTLPAGLLAAISHVPLCPEPQASEGKCPEASRIGAVHVAAGSGSEPLWETGSAYLTGPYGGGPFGLSVVVPAVAGPFNLGNVVVQAAIKINPSTAVVSVESDPLPQLVDGIPLRVKTVNITLEHSEFTLNPTDCTASTITGTVTSAQGTQVGVSSPFDVAGCQNLPFKPVFTASTAGKASKAGGASLVVKVASKGGPQPGQEANIRSVKVDLPKQLPSRLTTLQKACTEAQFDSNPAGCPKESDVGTATASTPILADPLVGPAYLVSHGGAAFPDLEIVLQGEGVTLVLDGNTAIKNGITSSTFKTVPDAPISSFELALPTGQFSVLGANVPASANYSLCGQTLSMPTAITGQNGAVLKQTTAITVTGCGKAKTKSLTRAQKLKAALKACRKRAKGKRAACEKQARKRYGPLKQKQSKKKK